MIDVVIPAHTKDFRTLRHSIRGVLRYVSPLRRVVVVSATPYETRDERVIWVPEPDSGTLPSLEAVHSDWESRSADATPRAAWIYQQLLKLGAATYIEDLTPRFLVIDADVIFLRPVSFDADQGRFLYSRATEYHPAYNESFRRLFQSEPPSGHSFTAHHMLYDRDLLEELFAEIEQSHEESWFWAYVHAADPAESSAINEQDMFGLWMLSRHPELSRHRQLFWRDVQFL
ncbi:MAG: DUF6492 family protein, partial [Solirubrobacterales bacterium]